MSNLVFHTLSFVFQLFYTQCCVLVMEFVIRSIHLMLHSPTQGGVGGTWEWQQYLMRGALAAYQYNTDPSVNKQIELLTEPSSGLMEGRYKVIVTSA